MPENLEPDSTQPSPTVYDHLAVVMDQLIGVAWQRLGLQPEMVTGRIEPDFAQARVAIDVAAHIAGIIEPQLEDGDRRQVQTLIRDLRINYVQKTSVAGS